MRRRPSKAQLKAMIEEAIVDAHDESEQVTGWFTMIEQHLAVPFATTVFGAEATVTKVDIRNDNTIVAVCVRARERQVIGLLDLPLPSPEPAGSEWIEAYRYWLGETDRGDQDS